MKETHLRCPQLFALAIPLICHTIAAASTLPTAAMTAMATRARQSPAFLSTNHRTYNTNKTSKPTSSVHFTPDNDSQPPKPFMPSQQSQQSQRRNHIHFATIDEESAIEKLTKEEDEEDDSVFHLRQITFLGLSAPRDDDTNNANNDNSDNTVDNGNNDGARMDARNLAEFLMEIGACSVSITDSDADTSDESPLFDEPSLTACSNDLNADSNDSDNLEEWAIVISDLAAGRNLWKRCDVSAHFPSSYFNPQSVIDSVQTTFQLPSNLRYEIDHVPDLDWIQHVQESWTPIVTESKFVLRFPWHEDAAVMTACQEKERERMKERMEKQFLQGVKREGAVVHFESYEDDMGDSSGMSDGEMEKERKEREYVQIKLEGGIAFGTGEHPTTRLCLDWVRDRVERQLERRDASIADSESSADDTQPLEPLHFIDYGAGSGVLGIAAAAVVRDYNQSKRRTRSTRNRKTSSTSPQSATSTTSATVVGVEIDADAIHIANENAKSNQVEMKNYLPDYESLDGEALSVVMRAVQRQKEQQIRRANKESGNSGDDVNGRGKIELLPNELNGPIYDLCAANILASPLINLAPTIASLVKSGGEIGLSGVLATQAERVVEAYEEFFEGVRVEREEGGWVLITGRRK